MRSKSEKKEKKKRHQHHQQKNSIFNSVKKAGEILSARFFLAI